MVAHLDQLSKSVSSDQASAFMTPEYVYSVRSQVMVAQLLTDKLTKEHASSTMKKRCDVSCSLATDVVVKTVTDGSTQDEAKTNAKTACDRVAFQFALEVEKISPLGDCADVAVNTPTPKVPMWDCSVTCTKTTWGGYFDVYYKMSTKPNDGTKEVWAACRAEAKKSNFTLYATSNITRKCIEK